MSESATAEQSAVSVPRLGVQLVLRTDVGLVRSENQDFGTYTTPREESHSHPGGRLLVVADGMGGHRGGATASRLAGETVKAQYLGSETYDIAKALREALTRANARIFTEAQANPDLRGIGTTTSALVVKDNQAWFAHVGDSRIYLVRGDEIRQITEDHSLVASMVREGLLTAKEAETHPRRNVLQRSMGVSEDVEIDVSGPFPIQENDVFVLCSDGLHGLVKEHEIKQIAGLPIDQAATEYVRLALARGAPDNVTVIVARIVPVDDIGDKTLVDADETLADHPLDETQRDTAPIVPIIEDKAESEPSAASGDKAEAPSDIAGVTLETPNRPHLPGRGAQRHFPSSRRRRPREAAPRAREATLPPPPRGCFLKWARISLLLLGGTAGAWFYWNHSHQGMATHSK
jgi:protein phosphatase